MMTSKKNVIDQYKYNSLPEELAATRTGNKSSKKFDLRKIFIGGKSLESTSLKEFHKKRGL